MEKRENILGRPRAYRDGRALRREVERYFRAISREIPVTEPVDEGERDKYGHVIYAYHPVRNDAGEVVTRRDFAVPPTVTALCRHLGISRQTWAEYHREKEFAPVVERAKAVILEWLEEQLLTRQKGVQGVIFNLQNNFDWKEKAEIEAGARLREELDFAAMSDERLRAMVREAGQDEPEQNTDPGGAGPA